MPVNIIENFQLGTDLPLDARYVVGDPNDVSLYWYDGMLIYNSSTNQLFVVKDTTTEQIIEILDSSSNVVVSLDQSLNDLKIYVDGSLAERDSSINLLFQENDIQDASIIELQNEDIRIDGSLNLLFQENDIQDSSIVALRNEDIRLDGSISVLFIENDIQDASIIELQNEDIRIDGSLNLLFQENDIQDSSIVGLRNDNIRIDGSLNLLFQENDIQDASIIRIDGSIVNLYDTKVDRAGDTMTGPLVIDSSLSVSGNSSFTGNVDIGGNLRVDGSTTFLHTDVLDVSIAWINLNTGLVGPPPEWLQSGIVVERGDASAFGFIYDETRQEFRIGILGPADVSGVYADTDTQAVATREDTPIDTGIAFWNDSLYRFDTSSGFTVGTITEWNNSQDASIVALREEDIRQDGSLNLLFQENDTQDVSIVNLRNEDIRQDGSLNLLFKENDIQDASIVALREEDVRQDGSLNLLFQENDIQDASIIRIDGSIVNLYDTKVDRAGDTMTGNLTTPGLKVLNDVSIGKRLHFDPCINATAVDGDLWVEPSTYNLLYKHPITIFDASSYDLTNRLLRTENDWVSFPDSSTLDAGDRILIEDAQDGFKKKYISADAFAQAAAQLLFPAYDDSKPEQSTTSTTYVNALTLTTDPSAITSTYRIGWTLQIANSKNGKISAYRIQVDGSIILEEEEVTAIASNSYSSFSGFEFVPLTQTLDPSGHIITIDYRADTGSTAFIQYARLEFRKADVET